MGFSVAVFKQVLDIEVALPGIFCQNFVHILMRPITIRSQSFTRIKGIFLGHFTIASPEVSVQDQVILQDQDNMEYWFTFIMNLLKDSQSLVLTFD